MAFALRVVKRAYSRIFRRCKIPQRATFRAEQSHNPRRFFRAAASGWNFGDDLILEFALGGLRNRLFADQIRLQFVRPAINTRGG